MELFSFFKKREKLNMYSAFDKCLEELGVKDIELNFDKEGRLLAPNMEISEYNIMREKFGDELVFLLCKIIRTSTFINGCKNWNGFGDWMNGKVGRCVFKKTGEPMIVFHASKVEIPTNEGLVPQTSDRPWLSGLLYFSATLENSLSWLSQLQKNDQSVKPFVHSTFLDIRNPRTDSLARSVPGPYQDGSITRNGQEFMVKSKQQIFHIPITFASGKPIIKKTKFDVL